MKRGFLPALLFFLMMLPAPARADLCQDMQLEIDDLLAKQRNVCKTDDDCASHYFRPDPCAAAVTLPKEAVTSSFMLELVKMQDAARNACKEKWQEMPPCSSTPAKPVCRDQVCVDEMQDKKPE